MKWLYLVRHAKSSWKYPRLDDFERPLNKRGRKNAPFMGNVLRNRKMRPEMIISSPANRAAMTARIFAAQLNFPINDIYYDESLYGMGAEGMHQLIMAMDDSINRLMVVGHNPGLTNLANTLGDEPVSNVPTSGIYAIRFNIASWDALSAKNGKTDFFDFPKKFTH